MQPIGMPFFQYFDNDGTTLQDGSLYFGTVNLNPETNPISIYWDFALTQPAAQPIKTLNGFVVRDGTMAQLFCSSDYSFTVRNKKGIIVTSARNSAESAFGVVSAQLAAATAAVSAIGTSIQSQLWVGFTTTGGSGSYVLNPLPALTGYVSNPWKLNVKFHTNGTGTDTIDVNGLGAKNIKQYDSVGGKTAPKIKAGMITDLIYDGTDWLILNPLPEAKVGSFLLAAAAIAPEGYLLCQNVAIHISRSYYAALFAAIGTTWGSGDGLTTFTMPWFPDNNAILQGYGALGYGQHGVGQVISHTHVQRNANQSGTYGGAYTSGTNTPGGGQLAIPQPESTGGAENLAAGKGVAIYVKY